MLEGASARSVKDIWLAMPYNLCPVLDEDTKEELVEKAGTGENTQNLLGGTCRIDTLAADYMSVTLTEKSSMQIRMLPSQEVDTLLCLIHTINMPFCESSVKLFTKDWKCVGAVLFSVEDFVSKPDTISIEEYKDLLMTLDPYCISSEFTKNKWEICATLSVPLVTLDDKERLEAITRERRYLWDGENFRLLEK